MRESEKTQAEPTATTFSKVQNDDFYASFTYPPLNPSRQEFRLLRIDAFGFDHHELISNVALDSPPPFSALSYVCGSPANTRPVTVNRISFNAFANLYLAIADVRECWHRAFPGQELLLWTDQICINQSNNDERSSQVANMRSIYSSATRTLIWLPASLNLDHQFQEWTECRDWLNLQTVELEAVSAFFHQRGEGSLQLRKPSAQTCKDIVFAIHEVYALAKSEWWTRAWVYQEFLVSRCALFLIKPFLAPWADVMQLLKLYNTTWDAFGQWRYDVKSFLNKEKQAIRAHMQIKKLLPFCPPTCDFCHILQAMYADGPMRLWENHDDIPDQYSDIQSAFAMHYLGFMSVFDDKANAATKLSLSTAMQASRNRKTSEPRDKIYAYLGLLRNPHFLVPDYRARLNVLRTKVARQIIIEDKRLDILVQTREDDRLSTPDEPLPSWVPTWAVLEKHRTTSESGPRYFSIAKYDQLDIFPEIRDAPAAFEFHGDGRGHPGTILKARGMKIDSLITQIQDPDQKLFYGTIEGLSMRVGSNAEAGDEVWVLFGARNFLVLRNSSSRHQVVCEAILAGSVLTQNKEVFAAIAKTTFREEDIYIE